MRTKRNQTNKNTKRITLKRKEKKEEKISVPVSEPSESIPNDQGEGRNGMATVVSSSEITPLHSGQNTSAVEKNSPSVGTRESIPSPEEEEAASATLEDEEEFELLTFSLAKEEYAIDIMMIQEITKLTNITLIPRACSYIHGIVTLRGNVIPVFNVHARLKLDPFVEKSKSRFVVCQLKEGPVAITVDEVIDVVHLKKSQMEPPPSGVAANGGGFIKSIGRSKKRLLILLDIEKALQIVS